MARHQVSSIFSPDELELTVAAGKDIIAMMDNWVSKMGYPLVTVTEKDGGIHIRQDRFLETGPAEEKDNQTIWYARAE